MNKKSAPSASSSRGHQQYRHHHHQLLLLLLLQKVNGGEHRPYDDKAARFQCDSNDINDCAEAFIKRFRRKNLARGR